MNLFHKLSGALTLAALLLAVTSCNKSESYSTLLRNEEKAVNWFLSGQEVETAIPADSILEYGEDAPYYRLNDDGTAYLKVINPGDLEPKSVRPKNGEKVYFRFKRQNLSYLMEDMDAPWVGNSEDLNTTIGATSFVYGNTSLPSTTQYGTGVQLPLQFVGFNSEVYLVLKASQAFTDEQSNCTPYLFHIRYFKAQY